MPLDAGEQLRAPAIVGDFLDGVVIRDVKMPIQVVKLVVALHDRRIRLPDTFLRIILLEFAALAGI